MLNRDRNTIPLLGVIAWAVALAIKNDEILFRGAMLARDATPEILPASDTAGLKVVGVCPEHIDNSDDGELVVPIFGAFKWENDGTNPVVNGDIIAFVKADDTVCAFAGSTNKVVGGLVIGVDTDGVWLLQTPEAIAAAQALYAAGVASASNHIADPTSAAAITAVAPVALTYSDPAAITYVAPNGGATQDAEARASLAQLAADVAAVRTKLVAAGADLGVIRTPVVALVTDVTAVRTGSEANNTAIDSILAALETQEIVKTS